MDVNAKMPSAIAAISTREDPVTDEWRLPDGDGSCWSAVAMMRFVRSARVNRDPPVRARAHADSGRMGKTETRLIITASTSGRRGGRSIIGQFGIGSGAILGPTPVAISPANRGIRAWPQTCYGPARRPIGARRQSARLVHKAEWPGRQVLAPHLHGGNRNKYGLAGKPERVVPGFSGTRFTNALPQAHAKGIVSGG